MANHDAGGIRLRRSNPRHVQVRSWTQRGYADAMAGRGFCPEYETAGVYDQRNYENGRLIATNMLAAEIKAPAWRAGVFQPRDLVDALRASIQRVGHWDPRKVTYEGDYA